MSLLLLSMTDILLTGPLNPNICNSLLLLFTGNQVLIISEVLNSLCTAVFMCTVFPVLSFNSETLGKKFQQTTKNIPIFPRKQVLTFHANGDNLHEKSNPFFWEK